MYVENIQFTDVFDVVERVGAFSFRSRGRPEYGVTLDHKTIPRPGSTYAVAFAERGNWNTVLGWRDLATNDVKLTRPTWSSWCFALGDSVFYGVPVLVGGLLLGGVAGALALALAIASIGMAAYQTRRNGAVKQALFVTG